MIDASDSLIGDLISTDKTNKRKLFSHHDPLVWILSGNPEESAKWLSDRFLEKSIKQAIQMLICTRYYFLGIRNQRLFNMYAKKDAQSNAFTQLLFELGSACKGIKVVLRFINYNSKTAKWTRKCKTYCKFMETVLSCYLNEYLLRKGKPHQLSELGLYLIGNPISDAFKEDKKEIPIIYEPKNIPYIHFKGLKLNANDVWIAYRRFYASKILDPFLEYATSKTSIPEWLTNGAV